MNTYYKGDILKLRKGDKVYTDIPEKFVFSNRIWSSKLTHHNVRLGVEYENLGFRDEVNEFERIVKDMIENMEHQFSRYGIKVPKSEIKLLVKNHTPIPKRELFHIPAGYYRVVKTEEAPDHSYEGMNGKEYWPGGHHVFCVFEGDEEVKVDFYTSGCFTAMITEDRLYSRPG